VAEVAARVGNAVGAMVVHPVDEWIPRCKVAAVGAL